jgi:hypothetical protein
MAAGFNFGDVVKAIAATPGVHPSVLEKRSGHETLHFAFSQKAPVAERQKILDALKKRQTTPEMVYEDFYTIDVDPQNDYEAICDYLSSLKMRGLLMYEPDIDMQALLEFRFLGPGRS